MMLDFAICTVPPQLLIANLSGKKVAKQLRIDSA